MVYLFALTMFKIKNRMVIKMKNTIYNASKHHTMYIMRGLPGSGKSTLARAIARNRHHVYSTDDYWGEGYKFNYELLELAHKWNQERVENALLTKINNIVVDNTNVDVKSIKPYIDMARKYNYTVVLVEPNTSFKWDVEGLSKKNRHNVTIDVIQRMKDRFEHDLTIKNFS
jgi:2',3'-cyclic-nucleotide 3'-phosphodiesterase